MPSGSVLITCAVRDLPRTGEGVAGRFYPEGKPFASPGRIAGREASQTGESGAKLRNPVLRWQADLCAESSEEPFPVPRKGLRVATPSTLRAGRPNATTAARAGRDEPQLVHIAMRREHKLCKLSLCCKIQPSSNLGEKDNNPLLQNQFLPSRLVGIPIVHSSDNRNHSSGQTAHY